MGTIRVARLSNVFGGNEPSDTFLSSVVAEAQSRGHVELHQSLGSEKDYVHIDDVCEALSRIALHGQYRIYNVAAGRNTTHRQIADIVAVSTGNSVRVAATASNLIDPVIDITRLAREMPWRPVRLEDYLPGELRSQLRLT